MLALVFDLDGTLVDSAPDIHATSNHALKTVGLPTLDFQTVRGFIGGGVPHLIDQLLPAVGQPIDSPLREQLTTTFMDKYEHAVDKTVLFDYARDVLIQLKADGHKLALCTNKPEGPTHAALAHFALSDLFDAVVGGDTLSVRKPDPAPLREALDRIGVDYALYVGDSETDAKTAQNADLPFALFTKGYRKATVEELAPFAAFDDYRDLPGIVREVSGRA